jgi:hypothetical protein
LWSSGISSPRLSRDGNWDQELADAVPFEVNVDRQLGHLSITNGVHRDVDGGANGAIDAAHAPPLWRVNVSDF